MDTSSGSRLPWEYVDFELEIGEGGPRNYPVSVRSPAGEAQEEMRFPFDEWELKNNLLALENALLHSGGTRRRIPLQEEQPVQDFGRRLLQALLVGEVRTRYAMSLLEARRQNKGLRLKLRVHPPDLARLPWEFLYDPDRDEYLCLSSKTPLVRYLDLRQPVEQLPVSPPLRILGMVSSPVDLPELDVEHEKRLVQEAIKGLRTDGLVEMTWLEGETWSDLQQAMWGGPWHVFHFIGHGGFDEASEEGAIALAGESGRTHLLGARNLARLLDDHYPLRLAFLNSCEGARGSVRDAFSSTAATLVRRGIPAVIAMQYEITDRAAIAFARVFYRAIAAGLPVDAAVAAGRTAVSMESELEWGTPVLYMRSSDGRIFDISTATPPAQTEEVTDWKELERRIRLDELYAQARRSHRKEEWQAVVDIFEQIRTEDPDYPDPEELLGSARDALELEDRVDTLYAEGQQHMDAEEWQQALRCFEEVQRLKPKYLDTERLLLQAHQQLSADRTAQVRRNDLADARLQDSQAESQRNTATESVQADHPRIRLDSQGPRVIYYALGAMAIVIAGIIMIVTSSEKSTLATYLQLMLSLAGLVALHARQATSYGRLGLAAFLVASLGLVLNIVDPLLGDESLQLKLATTLVWDVGLVLFGTVTSRAGVLPRWSGWLLVGSGIIGVIADSIWAFARYTSPELFSAGLAGQGIYKVVMGLTWVLLGYALWTRRATIQGGN